MDNQTKKEVTRTLKFHAKALGIPDGAAESFITIAITKAEASLAGKTTITKSDLTRAIARELRKFNADLAYVYQNYDKII